MHRRGKLSRIHAHTRLHAAPISSSPRTHGTTTPLKLVVNRGMHDSVQAVQNPEQPLNAPLQLQAHHRVFEAAGIGEARGFPEPEHAVEAVAQFFDLKRS